MKINRNFNAFTDFKSLKLEVPTFCLVTGCVSARRDRRYYGNTLIALSCNVTLPLYPTRFMFYNSKGQVAGVAYLSMTDTESKCIDFYNESIVSYNGVDMLVPLSESLSDLGSNI